MLNNQLKQKKLSMSLGLCVGEIFYEICYKHTYKFRMKRYPNSIDSEHNAMLAQASIEQY
jgi:hypothetical protein